MNNKTLPGVKPGNKILVIRFSSIGDIVLASPVLRCIKKQLPYAEVHFLTKLSFKIVTAANPYVDKFFYYDDNMDELIRQLKAEHYDHVIDLHNNIRSNKIKHALKKASLTINKLSFPKFLLTQLNTDVMPNRHITQRSLDTVLPLGVTDDGGGLDYFIDKHDEVTDDDIPTGHLAGYIVVVIGATYYTKRFPAHKVSELCGKTAHPIILLGGKEDEENGDSIAAQDPVKIYNACGKFNISESADIIKKAKLVISNDTGMLYIACAFKRPVIALWGGTTPDLDVEPYYGSNFMGNQQEPFYDNIVLGLRCQPCSRYGLNKCPLEHFNCMEKISTDAVAAKVNQRIIPGK
jgi:ADP-heptose:LPS heptosyltransferase